MKMNSNNWLFERQTYTAVLDSNTGCLISVIDRGDDEPFNIIHPGEASFGSLSYTRKDQKNHTIMVSGPMDKEHMQLQDHKAVHSICTQSENSVICFNEELQSRLIYTFLDDGIVIEIESSYSNLSQFGLNLDFNFVGTAKSSYENQLLPATPYTSKDGQNSFMLLSRPNGRNVLLTSLIKSEGWKLTYSPYNGGHFIIGLKWLEQLDHVFDSKSITSDSQHIHTMKFKLEFSSSYDEAWSKLEQTIDAPIPLLPISGGTVGSILPVTIRGEWSSLSLRSPSGNKLDLSLKAITAGNGFTVAEVMLNEEGFYVVEAERNGKVMDATLFAFEDWMSLFQRNINCIIPPVFADDPVYHLCESSVWCWALTLYLRAAGPDAEAEQKARTLLDGWAFPHEGEEPNRCSIAPFPHIFEGKEYSPYHLYQGTRIQEQFYAVSIYLEAYRAFNNNQYLELAIRLMMNILRDHMNEEGAIIRIDGKAIIDYTTVTALVIPIVDLANTLIGINDPRGAVLRRSAVKVADYLVRRGKHFPTEGDTDFNEKEMEDGSISCTALSVLYVAYHCEYKEEYVYFAKEILDLHEAWVMQVPDVRMFRSSLRWWETQWEGDQDGPAINAGHAWTLWRSEADFYYAVLTGDALRLADAFSGYMTNACKIQPDGITYASFTPDYIPDRTTEGVLGHRYPTKPDYSLAYYLWPRSVDTWFRTSGIAQDKCTEALIPINGVLSKTEEGLSFVSASPDFKWLLLGVSNTTITIPTNSVIGIASSIGKVRVIEGYTELCDGLYTYVIPMNNLIKITIDN